jgi:hypothetical protein
VLAWDIARFGEDETVGMRREGGWGRVYRAHSKADTMTTTGHIATAHPDINGERGLNDFPTHVVESSGWTPASTTGSSISVYRRRPTTAARRRSTRSGSPTLEPRTTGTCGGIFETGEIDIDELDDVLAAQLGSIKPTVDSRGRIKIESKDDMRKRGLPSPDRADTLAMVMSRRATGGPKIDVDSHQDESITGDLMPKAW